MSIHASNDQQSCELKFISYMKIGRIVHRNIIVIKIIIIIIIIVNTQRSIAVIAVVVARLAFTSAYLLSPLQPPASPYCHDGDSRTN